MPTILFDMGNGKTRAANPADFGSASINAGAVVTNYPILAGQHVSIPVEGEKSYLVRPQQKVFVRSSINAALVGLQLDGNSFVAMTGDLTGVGGLALGVGDITVQGWVTLDAGSDKNIFSAGRSAAANPLLQFQLESVASDSNVLRYGFRLKDNNNASLIDHQPDASTKIANVFADGKKRFHYAVVVHRTGVAGADITYDVILDGVPVVTTRIVAGSDTIAPVTLSVPATNGGIAFGSTAGASTASFSGIIWGVEIYLRALTLAEVQARTLAGPNRPVGDSADGTLTFRFNFQDFEQWDAVGVPNVSLGVPEPNEGYGSGIALDTPSGAPALILLAGGEPAYASDSEYIKSNERAVVYVKEGHTFLNLFAPIGADFQVAVSEA